MKTEIEINIEIDEEEPQSIITPYKRLFAAVLYRAIIDLEKREHKSKVLAWIESKNNVEFVQSFAWYCDTLKMNPDKTRKKILNSVL